MKEKILCDICKREFEGEEKDMNKNGEVRCEDCKIDLDVEF